MRNDKKESNKSPKGLEKRWFYVLATTPETDSIGTEFTFDKDIDYFIAFN